MMMQRVWFSRAPRGYKDFLKSHGPVSRQDKGSPQKNFGAPYRSGPVAMLDEKLRNPCRLFAVLKTQQPANRSKELLISATLEHR